MAIYSPPSMFNFTPRHVVFSTWVEHLPFGYDLVAALRPSRTVELGAYRGLSFFCFCQSLQDHGLAGECFAVDTWEGDKHTSSYGEEIYAQVAEHAASQYPDMAHLLRMTFNDAVSQFADQTIDLLHIDGLHTYASVSEDFERWYPKVKPGGIILFHDVSARIMDFGVWRFWNERAPQFESFAFRHGFGLGVLRKPGGSPSDEPLFQLMFSADEMQQDSLRAFYAHAARHIMLRRTERRVSRPRPGRAAAPTTLTGRVSQTIRSGVLKYGQLFGLAGRTDTSPAQPSNSAKKAA